MRFQRVKVVRDTNTVYNRPVGEWEIPVLEFVFGDGNVQKLNEHVDVADQEYPDAASEFDRLTRAYGEDPQTGTPYVALVYGNARIGVAALKRAIDSAKAEDEGARPALTRAPQDAEPVDALLG